MKREDNREERAFALLQALGDLNEEDVLRAEPGRGIRKRRNWGSVAAAAAFILVCGSVVGALYISWPMSGGQSGSTSGAPPVSSSSVLYYIRPVSNGARLFSPWTIGVDSSVERFYYAAAVSRDLRQSGRGRL